MYVFVQRTCIPNRKVIKSVKYFRSIHLCVNKIAESEFKDYIARNMTRYIYM